MADTYVSTRRQLQGLAELLIAGPQYRAHGTIRLAVRPGGFGGVVSPVRVDGTDLVWPDGRAPLQGTVAAIAAAAGVDAGPPVGVYEPTGLLSVDDEVSLDPTSVALLTQSLAVGDEALRALEPGPDPVLWPEHFDVAITVEEVNYGVSAGDSFHDGPYAYVGPWTVPTGPFWNAPFGAVLSMRTDETVDRVLDFFRQGRRALPT